MNGGKQFEQDWKDSYKNLPYFYLRLADSNKFDFGGGTRFTPTNPCDSIQFTMPFLWLLELKSTKGTSISIARNKKDKNKMIKYKQIQDLLKASEYQGVIAGFIINFRPRETKTTKRENKTYFIYVKDFNKFLKNNPNKKSINEEDCQKYGIEIKSEIKRVHYKYDIESFINNSATYCINKGYIDIKHLKDIADWINYIYPKIKKAGA